MDRNKILDLLMEKLGQEELQFIIPHPFLPPRYRKECAGRNMIAILDLDQTIHLRWENARLSPWMSPTPGEFRRIISYSLEKLQKYKRDLQTFGNFVDQVAEEPFQDPIFDEGDASAKPKTAEKKGSTSKGSIPKLGFPFMGGGESPFPTWSF